MCSLNGTLISSFPQPFSMSSLTVVGLFSLAQGRQIKSEGTRSTTYTHYSSAWRCSNLTDAPVDIRIFSPGADSIMSDFTTILLIGNVFIPSGPGTILIDATHTFPFPGDPNYADAYDRHIPECLYPFVFVTGHVHSLSSDGDLYETCRWITIATSSYIRGSAKPSIIK